MEPTQELAKIIGPLLVAEDGETVTTTSQASLFLARDLTGKEIVLKRTTARSREQLDSAQNEVSLLRKIRHPNVVAFCGVWFKPLQPYGTEVNLLMELCPGGHLLDLQRRREKAGRPLTEQEIVRLFVQCCRGVECLHRFDPPVAHRDVKLENLLLGGDDGRTVKLCDFGSATTRRTLVTTKEERARLEDEVMRLTTPSYRAPELVDFYSRKLVSEQVDVWALGCVLYALAFGKHAFGEEGSTLAILSGKFAVPSEPYYSPEFKLLFFWLLEGDPNIRPRVGDVVDELDMLLGNRIKISAERRGSGTGARASSKLHQLEQLSASPTPPLPIAPKTKKASAAGPAMTQAQSAATSRGAAFVSNGAASSSSGGTRAGNGKDGGKTTPFGPTAAVFQPTTIAPPSASMRSAPRTGAMESRRSGGVNKSNGGAPLQASKRPTSNNPFDDLLPSEDPTFFSTPGLSSTSIVGFPPLALPCPFDLVDSGPSSTQLASELSRSHLHLPPSAHPVGGEINANGGVPHASSSMNFAAFQPSQAPIFFSDPPPQWRPNTGM